MAVITQANPNMFKRKEKDLQTTHKTKTIHNSKEHNNNVYSKTKEYSTIQSKHVTFDVEYSRLLNHHIKKKTKLRWVLVKEKNGISENVLFESHFPTTSIERMCFSMMNKIVALYGSMDSVNLIYKIVISLLCVIAAISGISFFGAHLIPAPIDKVLFFSSGAGALGFYIDSKKRGWLSK
ncbi:MULTISPECIES: hypothetical protein [unclassified Paenibacillus]|uniref:hypothetical protein n=1 Tax=Paenibacillus TaxID=44249 RepID=UPI000CFC91E4|nr:MULTISPECIES: hypothetical protein [unclassified Paenibacillus]PRA08074.1 hypothetical protein CQ043_12150 [Paenibacillus sp. MYb63]PRA47848.1 hypothetical protein CQ061_14680 [Paenibacillus sp. MYb67]